MLIYIVGVPFLVINYHGGNYYFPQAEKFILYKNYLSDLGRMVYFNQSPNSLWWVYSLILIFAGLGSFLFFKEMVKCLERTKKLLVLIPAITSTIGFIGIAVFPVDLQLKYHITAGLVAFISFFVAFGFLFLFRYSYNSKWQNMLFFILTGLLMLFLLIKLFAPSSRTSENALMLKVVSQKIIVLAQLIIAITLLLSERDNGISLETE
jgi:hypothetical protein